jgi:hypothetical protein
VLLSSSALLGSPQDMMYVVAVTVVCTVLAMTLFVNGFVSFESRFVQWFSSVTSSPRWFTVWILVMVLWVPVRHLLIEHGWLHSDADFVVATILWSGVPFMVENLLKSTSAKQMIALHDLTFSIREELLRSVRRDDDLAKLTISIREEVDRSTERDGTLHALLHRLLDVLEERSEKGGTERER